MKVVIFRVSSADTKNTAHWTSSTRSCVQICGHWFFDWFRSLEKFAATLHWKWRQHSARVLESCTLSWKLHCALFIEGCTLRWKLRSSLKNALCTLCRELKSSLKVALRNARWKLHSSLKVALCTLRWQLHTSWNVVLFTNSLRWLYNQRLSTCKIKWINPICLSDPENYWYSLSSINIWIKVPIKVLKKHCVQFRKQNHWWNTPALDGRTKIFSG